MYGATIPEDAEAILSKQAKNQASGALDEEAGGDSQPAQKSYGRIVYAGLALLAFVLCCFACSSLLSASFCPFLLCLWVSFFDLCHLR